VVSARSRIAGRTIGRFPQRIPGFVLFVEVELVETAKITGAHLITEPFPE